MSQWFASAVVRARWLIACAWLVGAVVAATELPTLEEAQSGALGDLVPVDAAAIEAERRSAELFLFPLASRTLVVERDPDGLTAEQVGRTTRRAVAVSRGRLPELRGTAGAYGVTNAVGGLSFARERGTTTATALLFRADVGTGGQVSRAERFAAPLRDAEGTFVGVTGAVPARRDQAQAITSRLKLVELVTLVFIALTVGVYLRSVVAPVVTLISVGVSYIVAIRLVAVGGEALGVSVPSEVEPVVAALLFGIVTDYALFFMSRFRALLIDGDDGPQAARRAIAELTPIVATCGVAVAAGCAALAFAELGFLKAFGPGMAMAVLIGLVVVLTLLPALLALLGPRLFWPSHPGRSPAAGRSERRSRAVRIVALSVRRPALTILASVAVIGAMASGLVWLELGNPIIRGLPATSEARQAYEQVSRGLAPGVVSPTTLILERRGIVRERERLASLQSILGNQPGVAGVLGPDTPPTDRVLGAALSKNGDAARFVLISANDPLGADAIRQQANLAQRVGDLAGAVGLEGTRASFAGDTPLVGEIIQTANDDMLSVVPFVLVAVALVLALFLRAIVAPLYLVVLAALAPLAALGLTVALFQGVLGQPELTYFVPVVGTVLLVSLGSDYNVFVAGSIWAELRHRPLREAIVAGGGEASHAIAAAGIVLAASFAALALVPVQAFHELAFMVAVGLLVDAFVIRLVLAPAVILLATRGSAR